MTKSIIAGDGVAQFVSDQLQFGLCPPYTTMGMEIEGKIIAGVIFNHFEGNDVHVTVAGKGWTRGFLIAVGDYCFNQLGCGRITFITEQPSVLELAVRLGGRAEGCLRGHYGAGRPGYIVGILKDEYRYLPRTA